MELGLDLKYKSDLNAPPKVVLLPFPKLNCRFKFCVDILTKLYCLVVLLKTL